jgi:CRISPR associated protein Cas1
MARPARRHDPSFDNPMGCALIAPALVTMVISCTGEFGAVGEPNDPMVPALPPMVAAALGLDPGLGVMHMDTNVRDSLACDLMEPVRPIVDAYVLNWLIHQPLRRDW